jgi:CelD/BcsL family acetyltransferase involved in cellulose biosynthesis
MKTGDIVSEKGMGTLLIEEINAIEKFRSLKEPWNALLQKNDDNNVFLTWEWLFTWWQYYCGDKKLRIIIIKKGDRIIGIVPLMEQKYRQGFISVNVLENLCSEECDYSGIILTENKHEALDLLLDYLARVTKDEKLIVRMYHIPVNGAFHTLLREQHTKVSKVLYLDEKPSSYCSYIMLPATLDEYFVTLSQKSRRNLRRAIKTLEKDYKIENKKCADGHDLQDKLNVLFELHRKRWGAESKFNKPEAREFYTNISQAFHQNGWLDFSCLNVAEKPVSLLWGFIYDNVFFGMTNAVDTDYSDYSVGNVHWVKSIEDAIRRGVRKYDFLKGDEAYKFHWTDKKTDNVRITIAQNSLRSKFKVKLLQLLMKYSYAKKRSFRENINLLLKKIKPQVKSTSN